MNTNIFKKQLSFLTSKTEEQLLKESIRDLIIAKKNVKTTDIEIARIKEVMRLLVLKEKLTNSKDSDGLKDLIENLNKNISKISDNKKALTEEEEGKLTDLKAGVNKKLFELQKNQPAGDLQNFIDQKIDDITKEKNKLQNISTVLIAKEQLEALENKTNVEQEDLDNIKKELEELTYTTDSFKALKAKLTSSVNKIKEAADEEAEAAKTAAEKAEAEKVAAEKAAETESVAKAEAAKAEAAKAATKASTAANTKKEAAETAAAAVEDLKNAVEAVTETEETKIVENTFILKTIEVRLEVLKTDLTKEFSEKLPKKLPEKLPEELKGKLKDSLTGLEKKALTTLENKASTTLEEELENSVKTLKENSYYKEMISDKEKDEYKILTLTNVLKENYKDSIEIEEKLSVDPTTAPGKPEVSTPPTVGKPEVSTPPTAGKPEVSGAETVNKLLDICNGSEAINNITSINYKEESGSFTTIIKEEDLKQFVSKEKVIENRANVIIHQEMCNNAVHKFDKAFNDQFSSHEQTVGKDLEASHFNPIKVSIFSLFLVGAVGGAISLMNEYLSNLEEENDETNNNDLTGEGGDFYND